MSLFKNVHEDDYEALVAENEFVTDIQLAIEAALKERGVSQADLAKLLSVSEARISHMLAGNGANLQARTVARVAHALGLKACVEFADSNAWVPTKAVADDEGMATKDFKKWVSVALKILDHDQMASMSEFFQPPVGTNDNHAEPAPDDEKLFA